VLAKDSDYPFCSDRCRVIDLGKWANGAYRISAPLNDPETDDSTYSNDPDKKPD